MFDFLPFELNMIILEFLVEDYGLLSELMPYLASILTTTKIYVEMITSDLFVARTMNRYGFVLENVRDGRMALNYMCERFTINIKRGTYRPYNPTLGLKWQTSARRFHTEHEILTICEDALLERHSVLCFTSATDPDFHAVLHKTNNIIDMPRGDVICLR